MLLIRGPTDKAEHYKEERQIRAFWLMHCQTVSHDLAYDFQRLTHALPSYKFWMDPKRSHIQHYANNQLNVPGDSMMYCTSIHKYSQCYLTGFYYNVPVLPFSLMIKTLLSKVSMGWKGYLFFYNNAFIFWIDKIEIAHYVNFQQYNSYQMYSLSLSKWLPV